MGFTPFGCGSVDNTSAVSPGSQSQSISTQLFGVARMAAPLAFANVTIVDLNGKVLATTQSQSDGTFSSDAALPGDFVVKVQAADGKLLASEVHNYRPESKRVVVNIPTSLAAGLHAAHPELTFDECQTKVLDYLRVPAGYTLASLNDSRKSPFVNAVFLQEADRNGGVATFLRILLSEIESRKFHSFATVFVEGVQFLGDVSGDLFKDFLKSETTSAFGWATRSMGLNFPFPSNADLSKQLTDISNQLNTLESKLTALGAQAAYGTAVSNLQRDVVGPINTTSNELNATLNDAASHPSTAPVQVGQNSSIVTNLVSSLGSLDIEGKLDELSNSLTGDGTQTGPSGRLEHLLAQVVNPPYGIDSDLTVYNGYGAYSNKTLENQVNTLNYYLEVLEQGSNLYAEFIHNVPDAPTLASNIRKGRVYLGSLAALKKQVAQQLPEQLSDDYVFIDRENALVWYMGSLSGGKQLRYKDAENFASDFEGTGPYTDGWRLPKLGELQELYARIAAGASAQAPSQSGKNSEVMQRWGWNIDYMTDVHRVWAQSETGFIDRFSLDTGNAGSENDFDHNDVILVRDYPNTNTNGYSEQLNTASLPPFSEMDPVSITISAVASNGGKTVQLHATANFRAVSGGTFKVGSTSYNRPTVTVLNVSADVTDKVIWSSSNDNQASVSNYEGSEGLVTWHAQTNHSNLVPQTFTARFRTVTGTTSVNPPASNPLVLSSIETFPYNVLFLEATPGNPIQQTFHAVFFYLDPTTNDGLVQSDDEDGAPVVTWTLTDRNRQPLSQDQGSGFITSTPNLLKLTSDLRTALLYVLTSSGGVDSTDPVQATVPAH